MKRMVAFNSFFLVSSYVSLSLVQSSCVDFPTSSKNKYLSGRLIQSIYPYGFQQCLKLCDRYTSCLHINYNVPALTCELMARDPFYDSSVGFRNGYYYKIKGNTGICKTLGCKKTSLCFRTSTKSGVCLKSCFNPDYSLLRKSSICVKLDPAKKKTWDKAQTTCKKYGSRLVVFNTKMKLKEFKQTKVYKTLINEPIFVGATERQKKGLYKWTTGEKVDIGQAWSSVKNDRKAANCLMYLSGRFNDGMCTTARRFICEEL